MITDLIIQLGISNMLSFVHVMADTKLTHSVSSCQLQSMKHNYLHDNLHTTYYYNHISLHVNLKCHSSVWGSLVIKRNLQLEFFTMLLSNNLMWCWSGRSNWKINKSDDLDLVFTISIRYGSRQKTKHGMFPPNQRETFYVHWLPATVLIFVRRKFNNSYEPVNHV